MTDHDLDQNSRFDVLIVGAGFAGLYMLHRLRGAGLKARVYEQADGVGGTWYWNRYPGARCDAESLAYSFSFSNELEQDWNWTERYAAQPEILTYANHVAERFDLSRDIRFERKVKSVHYDETAGEWTVQTDRGDRARARFVVMATGCLSVPLMPEIEGLDDFAGDLYWTNAWPHESVDFSGQRVGVIGTGSSAIQAIPVIAEQAEHLTVFQRTPNFCVPAHNGPLDPEFVEGFKQNYAAHRHLQRTGGESGFGDLEVEAQEKGPYAMSGEPLSKEEIYTLLEQGWQVGGAVFLAVIGDVIVSPRSNEIVSEFVRDKIRATVRDATTAELLCPRSFPIGTKRICVDTNYYATYNRSNVELVSLPEDPIERITPTGVKTRSADHSFDALVLATGFDAMTGALLGMDIRGRDGQSLADAWSEGPRTYLGLLVNGFPNLFTITGPGSPSVLSNMLVSIEQHVDLIMGCLEHMSDHGHERVEASLPAQDGWVAHVNDVANATLFPKAGSWYLGANVPGKPRIFMPYAAGVGIYRQVCDGIIAKGYEGFEFSD